MDFDLPPEILEKKKKVREFALKNFDMEKAKYYDLNEKFPFEIRKKALEEGIIEYDPWALLVTIEELFRVDAGMGFSVFSPFFGNENIMLLGTDYQKKKYLEPVLKGEKIMGFAVTEPVAGSDVAGIQSRIEKKDGKWILNGNKMFITNGSIADFLVVLARNGPPPSQEKRHHNMTFSIVEMNWKGVSRNKLTGKMGMRASDTAEIIFENVEVPEENILGEVGKGFYIAMQFFNISRIYVAAMALGIAQGALDRLLNRAYNDKEFSSNEHVQFTIAEVATRIEAARLLTYKAATYLFQMNPDPVLTSMAKYYAAETGTYATERVLSLLGLDGALTELERIFRDAKINEIWEGSSEIEELTIYRMLMKKYGGI